MQNVSPAWRRAQRENFTPESFLEIVYTITDPALVSRYTVEGRNQEWFSNLDEIISDEPRAYGKYITNELGVWILDTEIAPFQDYRDNFGYVSRWLSADNAEFPYDRQPIITINFERVLLQSIPGLTLVWSTGFGEFARAFTVTAYLDNQLVRSQRFTNSQIRCEVNFDVHNYNRIDIEINEWCLPGCRARIEELHIGYYAVFNKDNLINMTCRNSADPLGSIIPENTLIFTVDNTERLWNPANPQGLHRHLLEHQEVSMRYGYDINGVIEWIDGGIFFLSEWDVPQNGITATFTAKNVFDFMGDTYNGPLEGTLYDIAVAALIQADLTALTNNASRWIISDLLKTIRTVVVESFQATLAQVLQLCAHAASCGLWQDRRGTVRIEPIALGLESEITSPDTASFADMSRIHQSDSDSTIITNETNIFGLDERIEMLLPNSRFTFVSNQLSDGNAVFDSPPKLIIEFPQDHRYVPAIVITWSEAYGEMARSYNVNAYRNGILIDTTEVRDNKEINNLVLLELFSFDLIEVEILEWCLPHRRARMEYLSAAPDYTIDRFNSRPETSITVTRELRRLIINRDLAVIDVSHFGNIQPVQNPLITEKEHALNVGDRIVDWLSRRNIYFGDFRADPRLDPLDTILVNNEYGDKVVVVKTINYSWHGGAYWGWYEGRQYQS